MNSQINWFDKDLFWTISIKIKISISGHSYEVDIWSIGCIMYTLLVGKPPFETQTLKDTYKRIRANEYHVPSKVGPLAKLLIRKLLQVCFFDSSLNRGLCWMKWPSMILQNLSYFWNILKKKPLVIHYFRPGRK